MNVRVHQNCPLCGRRHHVLADLDALRRWEDGELAQTALSDLDVIQRDQLITGVCPDCQEADL